LGRVTRVLIVSQHPYPDQPTLRRNVSELRATGASIDLVCLTWDAPAEVDPGVRVRGIRLHLRRSRAVSYLVHYLVFFLFAFWQVSRLAIQTRYDVVQVDTTPDFLIFAALVPRLRRMPLVLYAMELMPELTAARLGLRPTAPIVRLAAWLERAATAWADRVITVNTLVTRIMVARGLDAQKVTVVPNSHRVAHLPAAQPSRPPFLVLPTTLIERYGVHVAIRALAELHNEWPELTLRVIGDGEARSSLIRLAGDLGLSELVIFSAGFLPWHETMEQVRQATLGIVPILADGYGDLVLPNKVLEFAALKIPAVCSRLRSIREHFPPDTVAYFEPGDAIGLAVQVRRLLRNPEEARRQAVRAQMALSDLSWESASRRYLAALGLTVDHAAAPATPAGRVATL
jgi:glycosyltransferase involved in cell wall biosynthesis